MTDKKSIFIHVPKTGGTSINCDMNNTKWQTKPDFYYRHIIYETKKSNSGDIFDPLKNEQYQNFNIFFFVREPIQRLFSEYYFLKDRKEFISLLPRRPKNFYEYCCFTNTSNSMIKFLLGESMYSPKRIDNDLYDEFIFQVEKLKIRIGVFEQYTDSLNYISSSFGVDWSDSIEMKRITINKPVVLELTDEELAEIKEFNKYDYKLYDYALSCINNSNFDKKTINLTGSKYDYVLIYTQRFIIIESNIKHKDFITNNRRFFQELNMFLHKNVKNGFDYMTEWNRHFINAINHAYKDKKIADAISLLEINDPLEKMFAMADIINNNFNKLSYTEQICKLKLIT